MPEEEAWETISVYTRKEAQEDGTLVDVTSTAKEAGFTLHTVVTRNVWERCVAVPEGVVGQDEQGRLWDVLFVAHAAALRAAELASDLVEFQVTVADSGREHTLWVHIGPGDQGEPVLTIMFPEDW